MDRATRFPSLFFRRDLSCFALPFVAVVFAWQCFPGHYLFITAVIALITALCFALRKPDRRAAGIILAGIGAALLFTAAYIASEPSRLAKSGETVTGRGMALRQVEEGCTALFWEDGAPFPTVLLVEQGLPAGTVFRGSFTLSAALSREQRGLGASFKAGGSTARIGADPVLSALGAFRSKCLALWRGGEVGDFYRAALFGDRKGLTSSLKTAFRDDGAMHLLAVSGLHVSILLGAVYYALFFLTRDRRLTRILLLILLPAVAVITGGGLPVLRATLMTGISLAVSLSGRRPSPLTGLSLSALLITLACPFAVATLSFLLTFLCTLGIITASGPLSRRFLDGSAGGGSLLRRIVSFLGGSLFISLSTFVFTLPCMAYFVGTVQPFSILYNLFFIPLFTPCVILGLLSLPAAFVPALSFLQVPAAWYGKCFLAAVRFVAQGALGTGVTLGAAAPYLALIAFFAVAVCFALRVRTDHFLILSLFLTAAVFLLGAAF